MNETNKHNFLCLKFVEKENYNTIDGFIVKLDTENICTPFIPIKTNKKTTLNVVSVSLNGVRTLLFSSNSFTKRWFFIALKENTHEVYFQAIKNGIIIVSGKIEI